jgi:hypothetical protein
MAAVDGDWDVTIKSPMGDQKAVLSITSDGASFSGKMAGGLGAMDIPSGTVDGYDSADADDAGLHRNRRWRCSHRPGGCRCFWRDGPVGNPQGLI